MDQFVARGKQLASTGEELPTRKRPAASTLQDLESKTAGKATLGKKSHNADKKGTSDSIAEVNKPNSPCLYKGLDLTFPTVKASSLHWKKISRDNLDLDYTLLFPREVADGLVQVFEDELDYFTGDLAKIQIFGRWHDIPRKQATYGDPGLTYTYSGIKTPSRPWPPALEAVRDLVCKVTHHRYNFVLVNRYKDGNDKMGEHKDDERELDPKTPIASISLGQPRDFYFRHQDARPPKKLKIDKVQLQLQHGSLLLMNSPTNRYWYHALPPRKSAPAVRINLTFRKIMQNH